MRYLTLLLTFAVVIGGCGTVAPERFAPVVNHVPASAQDVEGPKKPRLVVIVVFDQLRADHLMRFADRFQEPHFEGAGPGGFRYFMEQAAWYPYAEHQLLQAMTCPGHATISTGAYPYRHGIVLNGWAGS